MRSISFTTTTLLFLVLSLPCLPAAGQSSTADDSRGSPQEDGGRAAGKLAQEGLDAALADEDIRKENSPRSVRLTNGLLRFLALGLGVSMGAFQADHPEFFNGVDGFQDGCIITVKMLQAPEYWQKAAIIGIVYGLPSGILSYINRAFQTYMDEAHTLSDLARRNGLKNEYVHLVLRKMESLFIRSSSVEAVYLVITTAGLVWLTKAEFALVPFLTAVWANYKISFTTQMPSEVGLAAETMAIKGGLAKLKGSIAKFKARAVQIVSDITVVAFSAVAMMAVVGETMGSSWVRPVQMAATWAGAAILSYSMIRESLRLRSSLKDGTFKARIPPPVRGPTVMGCIRAAFGGMRRLTGFRSPKAD